jgi:hypothetical protein
LKAWSFDISFASLPMAAHFLAIVSTGESLIWIDECSWFHVLMNSELKARGSIMVIVNFPDISYFHLLASRTPVSRALVDFCRHCGLQLCALPFLEYPCGCIGKKDKRLVCTEKK